MMDYPPVYGCSGCQTTGGRMNCPQHGQRIFVIPTTFWPSPAPTAICNHFAEPGPYCRQCGKKL